jgi:hypothetical protein
MLSRSKSTFVLCAAALGVIAGIHSNTTYAQTIDSIVLGGQVCQPATNTTTGIKWFGGGTFNASGTVQKVVCPLAHTKAFDQIDTSARLVNRSASAQDLQCQLRISDAAGNTVIQETISLTTQPGQVALFGFANYPILDLQTAAMICQLPPKTGVTGITVDLISS